MIDLRDLIEDHGFYKTFVYLPFGVQIFVFYILVPVLMLPDLLVSGDMEIPILKFPCNVCGNSKLLLSMRNDAKSVFHIKCLSCKTDVRYKTNDVKNLTIFDIERIYKKGMK